MDIKKVSNSFWHWAVYSWRTRLIVGVCLIIIVIRLATTCINAFSVRIGCEEGDRLIPIEKVIEE